MEWKLIGRVLSLLATQPALLGDAPGRAKDSRTGMQAEAASISTAPGKELQAQPKWNCPAEPERGLGLSMSTDAPTKLASQFAQNISALKLENWRTDATGDRVTVRRLVPWQPDEINVAEFGNARVAFPENRYLCRSFMFGLQSESAYRPSPSNSYRHSNVSLFAACSASKWS